MTLLTSDLSWMRTELEKLLPESVIIYSGSVSVNSMGDPAISWNAVGTVAGRIDPLRSTEQQTGGAVQIYNRYTLTLPYSASVNPQDRVSINSVVYNIVGLGSANSWALDKRLLVELI